MKIRTRVAIVVMLLSLGVVPALEQAALGGPPSGWWKLKSGQRRTAGSTDTRAAPSMLPPKKAAEACAVTARQLANQGHPREAVALFQRASELDPRGTRYTHELAVLYDQIDEHDRALAAFRQALQEHSRNADLLNDFGYFHFRRGAWESAEQQFREARKIDPRHERALVNLGTTLGEQGRFQESFEVFETAVGTAAAHSNVGVLLAAHNHRDDARQAFTRAVQLDPSLRQPKAFLAALDSQAGEPAAVAADHEFGRSSVIER